MKKTTTIQSKAAVQMEPLVKNEILKRLFFTLFLLIILTNYCLSQQTVSTVKSGQWSDPTVWNNNSVPALNDDVQILDSVVIDNSFLSCAGIQIMNNGKLVADSAGTFEVKGNWTNSGVFYANYGLVLFNGSVLQIIGGTSCSQFYDIKIQNAQNVQMGSSVSIRSVLDLALGTLYTMGHNLTLMSDSLGTASVSEIKTGADLVGNVTVQRYMSSSVTGWRFLGSPVQGATLQDWNDDFITSGFPGSAYPSMNFCSIYGYDETAAGTSDYGYTMPASINDVIAPTKGFWCWVGPTPTVMEVTGPLVKSTQNFTVSLTPSAGKNEDGWNMIANPYASAIDWDAADWTKTGIEEGIYIWNPEMEQYSSYVNGVGVNGGTNIIASSQAFWVKANQQNPVLSCTEAVKSQAASSFNKTSSSTDLVKLSFFGNNLRDEAAICFSGTGQTAYNGSEDAVKLFSSNTGAPSVSTVLDTLDLSINTLPSGQASYTVPVRVKVGITGKYIFALDSTTLPYGTCFFLEDKVTGGYIDLAVKAYSFGIVDTTSAPRFVLHIGQGLQKTAVKPACAYTGNGQAIVNAGSASNWTCDWMDALGNLMVTHTNLSGSDTLKNLAPGKYIYSITSSGAVCGLLSDTIEVLPADTIKINSLITHQLCGNVPSGSIDASFISGGATPYSYSWSNGSSAAVNNNLVSGVYTLILNDANGCADTSFHAVQKLSNLYVDFNVSNDTILAGTTSTVAFTNNCSGQSIFAWDFGDGNYSSSLNPVHSYTIPGSYTVELTAADAGCSDVARKVIVVMMSTSIGQNELNADVKIVNAVGEAKVLFNLPASENAEINLFNIEGKLVWSKKTEAFNNSEELYMDQLASGIYLVEVKINGSSIVKKINK